MASGSVQAAFPGAAVVCAHFLHKSIITHIIDIYCDMFIDGHELSRIIGRNLMVKPKLNRDL